MNEKEKLVQYNAFNTNGQHNLQKGKLHYKSVNRKPGFNDEIFAALASMAQFRVVLVADYCVHL